MSGEMFVVTGPRKKQSVDITSDVSTDFSVRIAVDSGDANVQYIGKAPIGSDTSLAVWQIKKLDETSGTAITYAGGTAAFENVWDNREALSYS